MKFNLNHTRSAMGNDIVVAVEADRANTIRRVRTELDGFELTNDQLESPSDSYSRTFLGAGSASPGMEHTLVVSAEQDDEKVHSSTCIWIDSI
jgi:hypothetical protein